MHLYNYINFFLSQYDLVYYVFQAISFGFNIKFKKDN